MPDFADRVIAGRLKSRKLILPVSESVRPTKNRVRQAAFNLLTARVEWEDLRVADLCCGSGAWGLEAVSRGAAEVWMVDMDVRCAQANARALDVLGAVHCVGADVRDWAPPRALDVVLADPPYGSGLAQELLGRAAQFGGAGCWWCVETARDEMLRWEGFEEVDFRDYGGSRVWVGRRV